MDMERIKQSLRLRSGRTKKSKKTLSIASVPVSKNENTTSSEPPPSRPQARQRTLSALENADPSLRNWDKETGFQRLQLPPSITGRADSPSLQNWNRDTALPQIGLEVTELPQSPPPELQKPPSRQSSQPTSRQATPSGQPNGPNSSRKLKSSDGREPSRRMSTRYGTSGVEIGAIAEEILQEEKRTEIKPPPQMANPRPQQKSDSDDADFDLRPRPSRPKPTSIDTLSEMLFSKDHLNILIHDPQLMSRFSGFLTRYQPNLSAVVLQYLEYQKAIKAIEYANAVAASITPIASLSYHEEGSRGSRTPSKSSSPSRTAPAAQLSPYFAETSAKAFTTLLTVALPAFITYTFVRLSTECLIAEISNNHATPLTKNLIGGLSEVFCLSDPTAPDNPLIYCSEGFYKLTGYSAGDVLGQNCRFLQGPKTDKATVRRIREGVERGEAVTETVLNYRRDGRGFVNVLMISPLEDDRGKVKYFLGAQVDVSRLIAGGWGLEGLEKLVQRREMGEMKRGRESRTGALKNNALDKLRELSEMFDLEESAIVQTHSRSNSMTRGESSERDSKRLSRMRRIYGDDGEVKSEEPVSDESETDKDTNAWNLAQTGTSGKLPGVYKSYLLIRPAPSLRIIFVSPALRKYGKIVQSPFMSHLAAPEPTLAGLKESFAAGAPVTAKVAFMTEVGKNRDGTETGRWRRGKSDASQSLDPEKLGRTCWISATPLLGEDDDIGVWMVVMVDKASVPARMLSKSKRDQPVEGRIVNSVHAEETKYNGAALAPLTNDIKVDDEMPRPAPVLGSGIPGTPRGVTPPPPPPQEEAVQQVEESAPPSKPAEEVDAAPKAIVEEATTLPNAEGSETVNSESKGPEGGDATNPETKASDRDTDVADEKKIPDGENGHDHNHDHPQGATDSDTAAEGGDEERDAETTPTKAAVVAGEKPELGGALMGVLSVDNIKRKEMEEGGSLKNKEDSDPDCHIYSPYSVD